MESMLSSRTRSIGYSHTLEISAKARALRAEGVDVVDFSVGEPDFPTPVHIRNAAKRAIDEGRTRYTATEGVIELRRAIADRLLRDSDLVYDPTTEILVSAGVKGCLYQFFTAVLDPGDEVIVPAPYWVSYPEIVRLAGGTPVSVSADEGRGFILSADQLDAAITERTKAVVVCNPGNPTGAAYGRGDLLALAETAVRRGLLIVADEIYDRLLYDGLRHVSVPGLGPEMRERTLLVNGVSKAYAMTGWRIGYAAGPAEIVGGMSRIQSHSLSSPCTVSQYAALEALNGPQEELTRMRDEFARRRNVMYERVSRLSDVTCHRAEGAFYLFPNFSRYYGRSYEGREVENSYALTRHLLSEGHVAVVPGDAFGADAHIRLSYATSAERIVQGLDRMEKALALLE